MHYEKMIYVICPSSASKMTYVVSGGALNSTHSRYRNKNYLVI